MCGDIRLDHGNRRLVHELFSGVFDVRSAVRLLQ